jgi:RNA polymerase sigma-70 factor (ECF subfamily)
MTEHAQPTATPGLVVPPLERVYREHADYVWRLLCSLGVSEASREDAFHEVFLVVHRRLATFDGRASLPTWLFGITRNVVLHHRRSVARHLRRLTVAPPPSAEPEPDEVVAEGEARALVERFLAGLGDDQRDVFILAEIEGLRMPAIAEQLGVNLNTLYSRLYSARRQFARFIADAQVGTGGRHGSRSE